MKNYTFVAIVVLFISACSSSPFKGMDEPEYMTRNEVINATQECERARMVPIVMYAQARHNGKRIQVPYDVYCQPDPWKNNVVSKP